MTSVTRDSVTQYSAHTSQHYLLSTIYHLDILHIYCSGAAACPVRVPAEQLQRGGEHEHGGGGAEHPEPAASAVHHQHARGCLVTSAGNEPSRCLNFHNHGDGPLLPSVIVKTLWIFVSS